MYRKTASFASLFDLFAKAILPFAVKKVSEGGVRCVSLVYPDTQFLLEHDVLANGTEGDALALRFEMEGVAASQLKAVAEGLGENHATGFIESQLSRHDGIMKWNDPFVTYHPDAPTLAAPSFRSHPELACGVLLRLALVSCPVVRELTQGGV